MFGLRLRQDFYHRNLFQPLSPNSVDLPSVNNDKEHNGELRSVLTLLPTIARWAIFLFFSKSTGACIYLTKFIKFLDSDVNTRFTHVFHC